MRVLTYNLWHGLSPSSPVAFEALEPTGRRQLREAAQLELLSHLKPDICFFQEVNPVVRRAPEFAQRLRRSEVFQPDLVGLKLFGLGLPINLNSGLVILAGPSFGLKKLEGVSLSRPGSHFVHSWGSWQLREERFALFAEAMVPKWGRVLLVNTHLHHGLEPTPDFLEALEHMARELDLAPTVISEVKSRLAKGSERRLHELEVLFAAIEKYQRRFEVVMIGGDFNASPESEAGEFLRERGFRDLWAEAHPEGGGLSFDSSRNQANHFLQSHFPLTLVVEDLSFSLKVKDALLQLARAQENRPRRIDYLWVRTNSIGLNVKKAELIGLPDAEGLAPSDHFGVCADLELV